MPDSFWTDLHQNALSSGQWIMLWFRLNTYAVLWGGSLWNLSKLSLRKKKKKRKQQCTFLYDCSYHVIEPIDIHVHQLTAVMLEDLKKVYIKSPKYLLCTHILFTLPLFCSSNRNKRIHWNTLSLYIYKLPINIYPTSYWNNKCSTINLHVLKWQTHNSYNTGAFLMITSTCPWFMTVVSRCWQEIRICKNTDIVAENISVLWNKLQRNL